MMLQSRHRTAMLLADTLNDLDATKEQQFKVSLLIDCAINRPLKSSSSR
jgi:hypothetical protein